MMYGLHQFADVIDGFSPAVFLVVAVGFYVVFCVVVLVFFRHARLADEAAAQEGPNDRSAALLLEPPRDSREILRRVK